MLRRDFVTIGSLGALGPSMSLRAWGVEDGRSMTQKPVKSCILLWLDGGPSHLEMWDPKPNAPEEVRGPFQSTATNVSGIHISELLAESSKIVDKLAIIRSMTSPLGEHGLAHQYLLTGYPPSTTLQYPSYGSVVARMRAKQNELPPYIAIPESRAAGAGFLGNAYEPFQTGGNPAQPNFRAQDLELYAGIDPERLERRHQYLSYLDQVERSLDNVKNRVQGEEHFSQAFRLLTSAQARSAVRLDEEPHETRERYGMRTFGQSCLLARRLVERGVPFVNVFNSGWDTHTDLVLQLKLGFSGAKEGVGLIPTFDKGFAALINDLDERGLLDETLIIAMGEFGRTPKLNNRNGRDHWPRVFSIVLAGGGIRGGQVIGSSDAVGESPSDNPITPRDLAFSLYTLLGINPEHSFQTPDGRPVPINQGGSFIRSLLAG